MSSKQELIASIRQHNPTAPKEFLTGFAEPALQQYLEHLRYTAKPRGPGAVWVRDKQTAAIVTRTP